MVTQIYEVNPQQPEKEGLEACARIIRGGGTVAFPTETVYGLGANGLNPAAIRKIYVAKGRPSDNPLILHVAEVEEVQPLVKNISPAARQLMAAFWPGPLTLIFEKSLMVPLEITGGLNTVAVRIPQHPVARALIKLAGVPVAAPSANLSGKPSPTKASHVLRDLEGRVEGILSGGDCPVGVESTVLDMTVSPPTILRPGGVTQEMLASILPEVAVASLEGEKELAHTPRAPGMKYAHYAPEAPLILVQGEVGRMVEKMKKLKKLHEEKGAVVGIICTDETFEGYGEGHIKSMGSRQQVESIAANLFHVLRAFDETEVTLLLVESIPSSGMGTAVMNRLMKAAVLEM